MQNSDTTSYYDVEISTKTTLRCLQNSNIDVKPVLSCSRQGEFQGIAATGRKITISEVSIHRVLNGKIVEQWGFPDGLSHVQQLTEKRLLSK